MLCSFSVRRTEGKVFEQVQYDHKRKQLKKKERKKQENIQLYNIANTNQNRNKIKIKNKNKKNILIQYTCIIILSFMSRVMGIKCHFILQNNRRENATESTRLFGYIIHLGYDAHTSLAVDDQLVGVFVVLV